MWGHGKYVCGWEPSSGELENYSDLKKKKKTDFFENVPLPSTCVVILSRT